MSRRTRAILASATASVLALTSCSGGGDAPETVAEIEVGVAPDFFFSHLYFAVQEGFFAEHGIEADLTEFASGQEATEAITSGQSDITGSTGATVANLAGTGAPVKAVGTYSSGDGWFAIVGNEGMAGVESIEDVEGKSIAAQHNNAVDIVVRRFLQSHDETVSLIDYPDVQSSQLVSGLARGDYDAAALWEPNVSMALDSVPGGNIVLDSDEALPLTGYNVLGEDIYGDEDVRNRVLSALRDSIAWMDENPDEVLALAMDNSGIDDEEMAQQIVDKLTYRLAFNEEEVQELYDYADFFREQGLLEAGDEDLEEMYSVEAYEDFRASEEG